MEIACELARIIIGEGLEGQVIFLREKEGDRAFPIVIGLYEAYAIQRKVTNEATPRPLTHDLLSNVIREMGGVLERIVITELKNDTFYARLHVRMDGRELSIDSRPSDAIALAVQFGSQIFVEEDVLNKVGHYQMPVSEEEEGGGAQEDQGEDDFEIPGDEPDDE
ncbi:MAG: bifunctional nuclease family protein [Planctomycetota bacterium]